MVKADTKELVRMPLDDDFNCRTMAISPDGQELYLVEHDWPEEANEDSSVIRCFPAPLHVFKEVEVMFRVRHHICQLVVTDDRSTWFVHI
jgi:hypothetical protein